MVRWWPHDWNYIRVQNKVMTFKSMKEAKSHIKDYAPNANGHTKIVEYEET